MLYHEFVKVVFDNSDGNHMNKVNNVIKMLPCGLSDYETHFTLGIFWIEYIDFNHKRGTFGGEKFIYIRKDIHDVNINLWHQKYSLPCTKVLGFVANIVARKQIGIDAAEHS